MATADAAVILPEADIQDPMHGASTLRVPAQCRRVAARRAGAFGGRLEMKYRTSRVVFSGRRRVICTMTRFCKWGQLWSSLTSF